MGFRNRREGLLWGRSYRDKVGGANEIKEEKKEH